MIISTDEFRPQLELIATQLLGEIQPKTTYIKRRLNPDKWIEKELNEWYTTSFKSFPLFTSGPSNEVSISNGFMQNHRHFHDVKSTEDQRMEVIRELDGFDRDIVLFDLNEYIKERIDNTFYHFDELMSHIKNQAVFAGVQDNLIIMKNLLKFYSEVRASDDIQLNYFHNVQIPKNVADPMTDIMILLLRDKVSMLDDSFKSLHTAMPSTRQNDFKITWQGTQQEFGELINELTDKGFISFPDISMNMRAVNLVKFFDFSPSQKKAGANIAANILKLLKSTYDRDLKKDVYFSEDPKYKKRFDTIPYCNPPKSKLKKPSA